MFPENFCKIAWIRKPSFFSNLGYALIGTAQKREALFDTEVEQVVEQRFFHMIFKNTTAFTLAQIDRRSDVIQRDFFHIVSVDVGKNGANSFNLFIYRMKRRGNCLTVFKDFIPDLKQKNLKL